MNMKKDRVNIAVAKEVTEVLANTAEELGMTQYALANQILAVGLDLIRQGYSVAQIKEIAQFYKVMTELESVPVPGRILDRMIVEMYKENPDAVTRAWCDAGKMLAATSRLCLKTWKRRLSWRPTWRGWCLLSASRSRRKTESSPWTR
jgi:hypothetical protein